jgi:hypothetical protein
MPGNDSEIAYKQQLPITVIVIAGEESDPSRPRAVDTSISAKGGVYAGGAALSGMGGTR